MYHKGREKGICIRFALHKHERELERRRVHKIKVERRRRRIQYSINDNEEKSHVYLPFIAPAIFCLLKNQEGVIAYFESARRRIRKRIPTRIDLAEITDIDLPALCILSAFMLDKRLDRRYLQVKIPKRTSEVGKLFNDAQFDQMILSERRADFTTGKFLSRSDKKINKHHIDDVLLNTLEQIIKEDYAIYPL